MLAGNGLGCHDQARLDNCQPQYHFRRGLWSMLDFDLLVKPLPGESPCGPDLDFEGDVDYLNFFAAAETLLPKSYFEVADAEGSRRRFDPNSIDFNAELEKARPLLLRTR